MVLANGAVIDTANAAPSSKPDIRVSLPT